MDTQNTILFYLNDLDKLKDRIDEMEKELPSAKRKSIANAIVLPSYLIVMPVLLIALGLSDQSRLAFVLFFLVAGLFTLFWYKVSDKTLESVDFVDTYNRLTDLYATCNKILDLIKNDSLMLDRVSQKYVIYEKVPCEGDAKAFQLKKSYKEFWIHDTIYVDDENAKHKVIGYFTGDNYRFKEEIPLYV